MDTGPGGSPNPTPAGWYPDPGGSGGLRYWDGNGWTEHRAPAGPQPVSGPVGPPAGVPAGVPVGAPAAAPAKSSSGCLKVLLIVIAVSIVIGGIALVALFLVGKRVVSNLEDRVTGTSGRPASLPEGFDDYEGERTEDQVVAEEGQVQLGDLRIIAEGWSRTEGGRLVCGNVEVDAQRESNVFSAGLRAAGASLWRMVTPSGSEVDVDQTASSLPSSMEDQIGERQAVHATGSVCFPDPGASGQYAVTWQPRPLEPERAVWVFRLE